MTVEEFSRPFIFPSPYGYLGRINILDQVKASFYGDHSMIQLFPAILMRSDVHVPLSNRNISFAHLFHRARINFHKSISEAFLGRTANSNARERNESRLYQPALCFSSFVWIYILSC